MRQTRTAQRRVRRSLVRRLGLSLPFVVQIIQDVGLTSAFKSYSIRHSCKGGGMRSSHFTLSESQQPRRFLPITVQIHTNRHRLNLDFNAKSRSRRVEGQVIQMLNFASSPARQLCAKTCLTSWSLSAQPLPRIGATNFKSVSHGNMTHISCGNSSIKTSTTGLPAGFA